MSLTVYTASAGSGKTFTLAVEYIKLLIKDPYNYRKILAVTFTNKATEEMKMRILSQLYGIWKKLPDSNDYMEKVCTQLDIDENHASKQAGIALYNLLHNYNYFRIETIDSFFQSILRNLARELDLTTNLRLSLNDTQVEQQAVDKLIENLDARNEILFWIIDYIKQKISDDKSWNVITEIKNFGRTIFNDKYKDSSEELAQFMSVKGRYEAYVKTMKHEHEASRDKMKDYGEAFMQAIDQEGLTIDDFKYAKTGVYGFFLKLTNGIFDESIVGKRIEECSQNPESWYNKKNPNAPVIHSLVVNKLYNMLNEAIAERPKQWMRHKSAEMTLKHINQLRLLSVIEKKVRELNNEANRFLLSDTQHLLQSLIDGSDSPFIFEKTGSHLSHIMIDEFQDTSTVQWKNFKILLLECMSQEDSHNLIVGDVKQSIYRWRSGDWRLLNNISDEFGKNNKQIEHIPLDTNYRSEKNVVDFNNAFFEVARDGSSVPEIKSAYKDVAQKVKDGKKDNGYVCIELLPTADYETETLEKIKGFIEQLIDKGARQNEIAILVRMNSHIPLIAGYLQQQLHHKNINIVSDEAFRLEASVAVSIIISALHLLLHPEDNLEKAKLVKAYQKRIVNTSLLDSEILTDSNMLDKWLPEEYVENQQYLLKMPLYDLCQHLYGIFHLDRLASEGSYVATFNDKLSEFIADSSSDISMLIKEWNDNLKNINIQGTEINGIRLMSIHKSKGLEFANVIVPFCDWKIEKTNGNVLLCNTTKKPFGNLPLIPIDYSSKMEGTVYEDEYHEEHAQNEVDNLNLLYVAFTRAAANLYVIGKKNVKGTRSELLEACIDKVAKKLDGAVCALSDSLDAPVSFEYGNIYVKAEKSIKESDNVFLQTSTNQGINISSKKTDVEFRQSNESKRFTNADDEEEDGKNSYVKVGLVLHNILSEIRTKDDIEMALSRLEQDGVIYDENITNQRVKDMLAKRLNAPKVAEWFSGKWDVVNETTIITKDPETGKLIEKRPDRVMTNGSDAVVVDFKFGKHKEEYICQVREYAHLLREMGYENVKGYIWYVYSNKILEV